MSGYLQRIAASAARPARAVFPLVGGLFASAPLAGSDRQSDPGPVEIETQVEAPRDPSPGAMPAAQPQLKAADRIEPAQTRAFPLRAEAEQAPAPPTHSPLESPHATIAPREPLVAGWREITEPRRSAPAAAEELESDSRSERADRNETARTVAQQADESAGIHAVWPTPSVRQAEVTVRETAGERQGLEHLPAAPRESDRQPPTPMVRAAGRVEAPRQPAQRDEADRGVQDIEIHIGRIEVIAVPQQPQRTAPARTQHGETLDAYLKRHDRRSR